MFAILISVYSNSGLKQRQQKRRLNIQSFMAAQWWIGYIHEFGSIGGAAAQNAVTFARLTMVFFQCSEYILDTTSNLYEVIHEFWYRWVMAESESRLLYRPGRFRILMMSPFKFLTRISYGCTLIFVYLLQSKNYSIVLSWLETLHPGVRHFQLSESLNVIW